MLRLAVVVVSLLVVRIADADEWVSPTPKTLTSPNGTVQATIVPADGRSGARATIQMAAAKGGATTYRMAAKVMPVDVLVFDDGTLLALDNWHSLGEGDVATLYERDGRIRWTRTLTDLLGKTLAEQVPHSVSSAWWRKTPLESTLAKDGTSVTLTLFDENQLRITIVDGSATLVPVATLPDEPRRLLNRAQALVRDHHEAAAIPLLERAMAKDPEFFEAFTLFAETLQAANDHARVDKAFAAAAAQWKLPAKDGYGVANASVVWAKSLVALGRPADAEKVLRNATLAAPTYPNPAIALADLLVTQRRAKDADVALDELSARVTKGNTDTYALLDIGNFYRQRGELAKALARYLVGYKRDEVTNQFLYTAIAEVDEKLGRTADAIRIYEQLIVHWDKLGSSFANDVATARANIARLRGKP